MEEALERYARSNASSKSHVVCRNEVLQSANNQYVVIQFLGKGSFGQVVKCWKKETNEFYAVKILKDKFAESKEARNEFNMLSRVNVDSKLYFVEVFECFQYNQHTCIVTELLEQSLFDFVKHQNFNPLPLSVVKIILRQLLLGLNVLKHLHIIHTDMKPENIMLVNHAKEPYKVKIIDFGMAINVKDAVCNTYLQTRPFRAPEVILGAPFSEAVDMWSLGCIAAELYLGSPLYPGLCSYDQIRFICDVQGLPPADLLSRGLNTVEFFRQELNNGTSSWRLQTKQEYEKSTSIEPKENRLFKFQSLDEIGEFRIREDITDDQWLVEAVERKRFVELLKQVLQMNPVSMTDRSISYNNSLSLQYYVYN
ncbi:homeodomain-interacting protein kinase 2-like [Leptinotarsa decemlineata]|uniref:homeodomain-interacting protein kinase 2-like n=1 Tax=Leptinotarsa decemlineata TaxID=7539 RepID=UPI003D305468